jgi:hypothetical protein
MVPFGDPEPGGGTKQRSLPVLVGFRAFNRWLWGELDGVSALLFYLLVYESSGVVVHATISRAAVGSGPCCESPEVSVTSRFGFVQGSVCSRFGSRSSGEGDGRAEGCVFWVRRRDGEAALDVLSYLCVVWYGFGFGFGIRIRIRIRFRMLEM